MIQRFDRTALPSAESFYRHELGELGRPDRKGWAKPKAGCPFHNSKSKKSFSINLQHGGYFCFGCSAKGGDVVSFVMQRDHVDFRRAAERLGAWKDLNTDDRRRIQREQLDRDAMRVRTARLNAEAKRDRIAARDLVHLLEKLQTDASKKLADLERATPGIESHTKDQLLVTLCLLVDRIRDADREYRKLAGLEQEEALCR
jgi:DNA primase